MNSTAVQSDSRRGVFITLEGIDGAGKSTHVEWMAAELAQQGIDVQCTREPGGTALGEELRALLLRCDMHPMTEALLMFAARQEHLCQRIEPALSTGQWVVCDRFTDASYAYQGGGRQLSAERLAVLETWVQGALQPDCTFLFDVPLQEAERRLARSRLRDRFEHEERAFFERTRAAYLARARQYPERFIIIDSTQEMHATRAQLSKRIRFLVAQHQAQELRGG